MRKLPFFTLIALTLLSSGRVNAENLSAEDQAALKDTQALLKNPAALKGLVGDDERAALAAIENLTKGTPGADGKIYDVSSEIFASIVKKANGDSAEIQRLLLEAQANPKKFMESLSPEQQAKIRAVAGQIEATQKKK